MYNMRYIGCKKLLLNDIENVINENIDDAETFCDIFSGTTVVAQNFKSRFKIISNDLLTFSYCIQKGIVESTQKPVFNKLSKALNINNPISYFNSLTNEQLDKLPQSKRFCQNNYSPMGNRMYMTDENALKIDYIRNKIEDWKTEGLVEDSEYYYLLASLIEAVPYISNISGTYGAYNKWWDKRSLNKLELKEFDILNNKKDNIAFNEDGISLLSKISGDILYVDPPYNNRQYCPNYHVLETIATYDFPELKGITGQRDYKNKKSSFCLKSTVLKSFDELVKLANFKHIILSYSSEGLMSINDIENTLKKYGEENTFKMYEIPYRRFKSRKGKVENNLKELLFYIRKKA